MRHTVASLQWATTPLTPTPDARNGFRRGREGKCVSVREKEGRGKMNPPLSVLLTLSRIFEIYSIGCRLITLRSSFYKLGIDVVMGGKALIYKNRAVSDCSPVWVLNLIMSI